MSTPGLELSQYLPGIYLEQAQRGDSPLAALLYAAEAVFESVEESIEGQAAVFDPAEAPADERADFLAWLASWVDLELDESWTVARRRRLVAEAARLYRLRGTSTGLTEMIRSYFGIEVTIEEWTWPPGTELGRRSTIGVDTRLIEDPAVDRCFQIRWKPDVVPEDSQIRRLRSAIDRERPAHASCFLIVDLATPPPERLPELVIGEASTVGEFYIA